ncbi:hypothetical protein AWB81_05864 [Caballeronia arationis]|nr:hypothetical protein AWB81_05864 [Caballeronia arationis]
MKRRMVNCLILLAALCGGWSVSAADETNDARHDREGPVAKLFDVNGKFVGKLVYFPTSSVEPIAPGGVVLNINGALVYAPCTKPLKR